MLTPDTETPSVSVTVTQNCRDESGGVQSGSVVSAKPRTAPPINVIAAAAAKTPTAIAALLHLLLILLSLFTETGNAIPNLLSRSKPQRDSRTRAPRTLPTLRKSLVLQRRSVK